MNACESLNDSSVINARRRMRYAWIALGTYIGIRIFYAAYFEWKTYKYSLINFEILDFFVGGGFVIALIASVIASVRSALSRAFAPALIYIFIIIATFIHPRSLDMKVKAHIFAAYPSLCQTPIVPGQRVSECYSYNVNDIGGEGESIYFNPGDELSLPPRQWPDDIKRYFNIRDVNAEIDICRVRKTKHIVDHVYWMSYDCWKH